jgi:hypothetical protein
MLQVSQMSQEINSMNNFLFKILTARRSLN